MSLNDFSTITVSSNAPALTRVGFGTMGILAYHNKYGDRVRTYERASYDSQLTTEGFTSQSAAWRAMQKAFSQSPSVQSVKLLRSTTAAVVSYRVIPIAEDAVEYAITVEVEGETAAEATFTSPGSATVADICEGLKTAIDTLSLTGVTATDNTTSLDIETTSGTSLYISNWRSDRLTVEDRTPDPDIADELAAIRLLDDDWYALGLADTNSVAACSAAAGAIESMTKIFGGNTSDSNAYDSGETSDLASVFGTNAYSRSLPLFDLDTTGGFSGIAAIANLLPFDPGEGPFAGGVLNGRTLGDVTADALNPTQKGNLQDKGYSINITTANVNHVLGGQTGSGEWIDFVRFVDWFTIRLQEDLAQMQLNNRRIPYDARGLSMIESVLRARLAAGLASGGIVPGSETIELPDLSLVTPTDRGNRVLNGCKVGFQYSGAIQKVGVLVTITE